jgi:hypothetical protein
MQLKIAGVIAVLFLVLVSLAVAGCTNVTNSTSTETPPMGTSTSQSLTNDFSERGLVVVQPFSQSTNQAGLASYSGVVEDGNNTLTPYMHNITIWLPENRNQTMQQYSKTVADAQARGYLRITSNNEASDMVWWGSTGQPALNQTNIVWIVAQQPNAGIEVIHGPGDDRAFADTLQSRWIVSTDYATKI